MSGLKKMDVEDGWKKWGLTNHADRVDSVPFVGDCVAFAKKHMAQVRAAIVAHGLQSGALGSTEYMAFFSRPEACRDGSVMHASSL